MWQVSSENDDSNWIVTPQSAFDHVTNVLLASNSTALEAARIQAEKLGFKPVLILGSDFSGDARLAGQAAADFVTIIDKY